MHIENRTFDELKVGDKAELNRLITADDLLVYANVSGNHNPLHIFDQDGDGDGRPEAMAPGSFIGALLGAALNAALIYDLCEAAQAVLTDRFLERKYPDWTRHFALDSAARAGSEEE